MAMGTVEDEIHAKLDLLGAGVSHLSDGLICDGRVVCFASGKLVVVRDCSNDRLIGCVNQHSAAVRSLGLSEASSREGNNHCDIDADSFLLSSDSAGALILHRIARKDGLHLVEKVQNGHASAAVAFNSMTAVSASSEGVVQAWQASSNELLKLASVDIEDFLPECLAIGRIGAHQLIAVGGTSRVIRMYILQKHPNGAQLAPLGSIPGHRDWIRSASFYKRSDDRTSAWLATASNDRSARIWKLSITSGERDSQTLTRDAFDSDKVVLPVPSQEHSPELELMVLYVVKEALLADHTDQVTCVRWGPDGKLVTSSMDSSVAVWSPSTDGAWHPEARLGLLGGANSNALGFFSAALTEDEVFASSFSGARFRWRREADGTFASKTVLGGHAAEVFDACWEPQGRYFASCSADKTTRVWGQRGGKWCEVARPQVHGHAVVGLSFTSENGLELASVSEEKMVRLFAAPKWFAKELGVQDDCSVLPEAAELPALGLSNKPLHKESPFDTSADNETPQEDQESISEGPLEEQLMKDRLWSETAKLYAHGNDLSCLASTLDGAVLATAAHANKAKHAAIVLWDTSLRRKVNELEHHELTVTALKFSPCGRGLASASRDRSFSIFRNDVAGNGRFDYERTAAKANAHTRLLNCIEWVHGAKLLATGSRDKTMKLHWGLEGTGDPGDSLGTAIRFDASVTALGWCESFLAVGLENGRIELVEIREDGATGPHRKLAPSECPAARIRALQCRPRASKLSQGATDPAGDDRHVEDMNRDQLQVLCAGDDRSVRIMRFPAKLTSQD